MNKIEQPKVVVMGGGTGLSVLLRGIKHYPVDITSIVTVADDGGSSGRIREDMQIPAPGDIRNVLAALSEVEPLIEEMFQHRFNTNGDLSGHSLGNLILAAMTNITGNFAMAVHEMSRVLNVKGKVFPSANQILELHAEMNDGTIVDGESKIPNSGKMIKRVFITPENAEPLKEAIDSLMDADLIVIGPGSLYTSILPNLLVPKIGKAVLETEAKKVYICNLMTQAGETDGFAASDHVKAIYDHLGENFIQKIIVNQEGIPENVQLRYKNEYAEPVYTDKDVLENMGLEVISDCIVSIENGTIRHDAKKVAEMIYQILLDETSMA